VQEIRRIYLSLFCEINSKDAAARGISHGSILNVSNELGQVQVRALISRKQQRGSLFLPIHWTDQYASNARVDRLIKAEVDPVSGQPALKEGHRLR
jgi:assimilatory nitrate reductase catalytic subunit